MLNTLKRIAALHHVVLLQVCSILHHAGGSYEGAMLMHAVTLQGLQLSEWILEHAMTPAKKWKPCDITASVTNTG